MGPSREGPTIRFPRDWNVHLPSRLLYYCGDVAVLWQACLRFSIPFAAGTDSGHTFGAQTGGGRTRVSSSTPYVALLLTSGALTALLGLLAWTRRQVPGAAAFVVVALAITMWTLSNSLELVSSDLPTKLFWFRAGFLAMAAVPPAALLMVLHYSGQVGVLGRTGPVGLFVVAAVTAIFVVTDEFHDLVTTGATLDTIGPIPHLSVEYGRWFWFYAAYSFVLLLAAALVLIILAIRSSSVFRGQPLTLLVALLAPALGGGLALGGVHSAGPVELVPVLLAASVPITAWGIFHHRLFEVMPVARDQVVEMLDTGVIVLDDLSRIVDLNHAAEAIAGARTPDVSGQLAGLVLSQFPVLVKLSYGPAPSRGELSRLIDGHLKHYEVLLTQLRSKCGSPMGRVMIFHDITKRKLAEEALRVSEENYRTLAEASEDMIFIVGFDGVLRYANSAAARLLGRRADELVGMSIYSLLHPGVAERYGQEVAEALKEGHTRYFEDRIQLPAREVWMHTFLTPLRDAEGRIDSVLGVARDVSELAKMREELRELSLLDELTGIYNRRGFTTLAEQHLRVAHRERKGVSVLLGDLDSLKEINDAFGHAEGDRAIAATAALFKQACRASDVVARLGGDEFAVLAVDASPDSVNTIASRLEVALDGFNAAHQLGYSISVSIGTAYFGPESMPTLDGLLGKADELMYQSKRRKRRGRG